MYTFLKESENSQNFASFNGVKTPSFEKLNISDMEKKNFLSVSEISNGVQTPSVKPLTNPVMGAEDTVSKLFLDFNGVEETEATSNLPALERICKLATNNYYLVLQPKTNRSGKAYLWIKATKQGEDREEFALYVNDEILNVVMALLFGKPANISGINADDLENFNQRIPNFEYELFMAEKGQGKTMKKTYTTTGQTYSSYYKQGVITYKPYLNPELKAYLIA